MKKLVLISLLVATVVALSAGDASAALRYYGGSYTYYSGPAPYAPGLPGWPWYGDASGGSLGPFPYSNALYPSGSGSTATNSMSDGTVTLAATNQTYDANPAQVTFDDRPGDVTFPGTSVSYWGNTPNNNRFDAILLDLGREVEIDSLAAISNLRYASSMSLQWFRVWGSNDGVNFTDIVVEEPVQNWQSGGPAQVTFGGTVTNSHIFVRPASAPIGLFRDGSGNYTLDTVTYRYLKFALSRNGGDPDLWDSTALAEIIIENKAIAGDCNKDNDVDLVDLGALAGNYGKTSGATWEQGDFNGDGDVDLVDLGALAGNYGFGVPVAPLNFAADAASVGLPEPATMMLLLGGSLFGLLRRRS